MGPSVGRNIMLLFCLRILDAQTIIPTPGFLQDVGGQIPMPEQFSFEPQFQLGMQGNSGNGNPFAYTHGLQFRRGSIMTAFRTSLSQGRCQNLHLSEHPSKSYLGIYEEAILQFPEPSYSHQHFQRARFFAGYGFNYGKRMTVLLGFRAVAEVSSSGSTVTLFYGPAISLDYRFTNRKMNEKHQRTTAFKGF